MKTIPLPKKFQVEEIEPKTKAKISIEPCYPGYGMTLGNALRRVMLNSLPGGAVTAVKIKGAKHEFSAIDSVTEDVMQIILNLKQLNLIIHSEEPVVLNLKIKGEKEVTAADIELNSDVEIVNKDLVIATVNDENKNLEMEIIAEKGIGYVPTEERESPKEIGLLLVDSIFTPVLNVGLDVESARVGKRVDYDKIVLNIETDGTLSPEESVQKASEILVNQFSWLMQGGTKEVAEIDLEAPVDLPEVEEANETIDAVDLQPEIEVVQEVEEPVKKKRGRPKKNEE